MIFSKSLSKVEKWNEIYIWELSKCNSYWLDFDDDVISSNFRMIFPEYRFTFRSKFHTYVEMLASYPRTNASHE